MLNVFINSTTYGQVMGATFDLAIQGTLADKRLTALEDCAVQEIFYEKEISAEKVSNYIAQGLAEKVTGLGYAITSENIRVNSIGVLLRELALVESLDTEEPVTVYIPKPLLDEIQSGRIRYYLGENTNTYYSETEILLWNQLLPIMQRLFMRLVFKNIETCKVNNNAQNVDQALRVDIYRNIYSKLLPAYKEMKAIKTGNTVKTAVQYGSAF